MTSTRFFLIVNAFFPSTEKLSTIHILEWIDIICWKALDSKDFRWCKVESLLKDDGVKC